MMTRRLAAVGLALVMAGSAPPAAVRAADTRHTWFSGPYVFGSCEGRDQNGNYEYVNADFYQTTTHQPGGPPTTGFSAYLSYARYDDATGAYCYGYAYTDYGVGELTELTVAQDLSSATASGTAVEDCYDSGGNPLSTMEVPFTITYAATGDTLKGRLSEKYQYIDYLTGQPVTVIYHSVGSSRQADFSATIAGDTLSCDDYHSAVIGQSKGGEVDIVK